MFSKQAFKQPFSATPLRRRILSPMKQVWLGSLAAATLLFGSAAQAQVSLSPMIIELQAERGQAQGVINITNNTPEEFRARVYVEPFTYTRDEGFTTLPSDPDDLTPYLQFSPRELSVPPNASRRIRFVSRFPPSMPQGEYRAVIFTENLVETLTSTGVQVDLKTRIGATVFIRNGELLSALTATTARVAPENRQVQLLVQNTGPASARAQIVWELAQGGQVVRSGATEGEAVIAETERYLRVLDFANGDDPLAPGTYQLQGEIRWLSPDREVLTEPFNASFTMPAS